MAFSFWNIFFRSKDIRGFSKKNDEVTNRFSTKVNHKIRNIAGNIGVVLLKLGIINVRHKMRPGVLLPWQQFCFQAHFMRKLTFSFFALTRYRLLPMSW